MDFNSQKEQLQHLHPHCSFLAVVSLRNSSSGILSSALAICRYMYNKGFKVWGGSVCVSVSVMCNRDQCGATVTVVAQTLELR